MRTAGRSNWLKGLALVLCYVVVAFAFYFHTSEFNPSGGAIGIVSPKPAGLPPGRFVLSRGAFAAADTNKDGQVSRQEFRAYRPGFKQIDTNGDGVISVNEAAAVESFGVVAATEAAAQGAPPKLEDGD